MRIRPLNLQQKLPRYFEERKISCLVRVVRWPGWQGSTVPAAVFPSGSDKETEEPDAGPPAKDVVQNVMEAHKG